MTRDHFESDNAVGQTASSAINASIELSKLVIENRVRLTDRMINEDI